MGGIPRKGSARACRSGPRSLKLGRRGSQIERATLLAALDRVFMAAVESSSLDELLERLLAILLEAAPSVDTAAILLREGDVLRVRASVGLEGELGKGFTLRVGDGFAGLVAQERRPLHLSDVCIHPRVVESPIVRDRGVRALYGVPLVNGDEVIGVAHMGSLSVHAFRTQEEQLFSAVASRATVAIAQQLLAERQRRVEEAVRQAKDLITLVVEQSGEGIVVADEHWRLRLVNPAAARQHGAPLQDVPPEAWPGTYNICLRDGRPMPFQQGALYRALQGEVIKDMPFRVRHADGSFRELIGTATPLRRPDGSSAGAVLITRDETELRRREEMQRFLSDATAVLTSSLDFRRNLASLTRLAVPLLADICILDLVSADGHLKAEAWTFADPEKQARFAAQMGSIVPVELDDHPVTKAVRTRSIYLVQPLDEDWFKAASMPPEAASFMRGYGLCAVLSVPLLSRDTCLGALSFCFAESGRAYAAQDVETAAELGRRVAGAIDNALLYEEAQRAIRVREDVLAVVSHDLRNPLGAIHLSADLLEHRLRQAGDARLRKYVETIVRCTDRMERLIGDLLDMASIRAGRMSVEPVQHEAAALVAEALDLQEPLAREKGITLERQVAVEGARLLCDRGRVLQVFSNLVGNAIKFCAPGDTITVGAEVQGHAVHFSVRDTGPGIPAEELPHVFEPYWSARQHAKKGTGLGLFITKGIIDAHGGGIRVESVVQQGTTFYFSLPCL
jgi:PAS domain S-box-containing protein